MHKYRLLAKKGEGTFSDVLKAESIETGKHVAIKCMKQKFESAEQVEKLRELQALRKLKAHPGVIKLQEVLFDKPTGRLAFVFDLEDKNLYEMTKGRRTYLPEAQVRGLVYQLVKALDYTHRNGIFHRDIKPENLLVTGDKLKIADYGSCKGVYSRQPYTEYISTRWYRAPECLLTSGYYGFRMDLWSVGCVFFELVALYPLFPGTNELDQVERIHNVMGTPPDEVLDKFKQYATHIDFNFAKKKGTGIAALIPHASQQCVSLIEQLLAYDPEERITARQALRHPYFKELRQAEKQREKASKARQGKETREAAAPARRKERDAEGGVGERALRRSKNKEAAPTGASASGLPHISNRHSAKAARDSDREAGGLLPQISPKNKHNHGNKPTKRARQAHDLLSSSPKQRLGNNNNNYGGSSGNNNNHSSSSSNNSNSNNNNSSSSSNNNSESEDVRRGGNGRQHESHQAHQAHQAQQGHQSHQRQANHHQTRTHQSKKHSHQKATKYGYSARHSNPVKSQYTSYKSSYQSPYSQKNLSRKRAGVL